MRVVGAYRCAVRTTKVTGVCAVWSHLQLQESLDVNLGKPFTKHACCKAVKDGVFFTKSKHTLPLEINQELDIGHGSVILTKDDVQCQGSTVNFGTEIHDSVIQYDTTTVLVKEISVEMGEDKAVNLDNNQELPSSCQAGRACTEGLDAYMFKVHVSRCPLYQVRQAMMNRTTVQVQGVEREALVSNAIDSL